MKQKVIFTADDYGAFDFIDQGIESAVAAGQINSVAAFANTEGAADKILQLQGRFPDLEIGCHFTLTSGKPVLPPTVVPSLVEDGLFRSYQEFSYRMTEQEVEAELQAQLEVFEKAKVPPRHLSSHHGALDFFEKYHKCLLKVSHQNFTGTIIPMRSALNEPGWKRLAYHEFLKWCLEDDLSDKEMSYLMNFQNTISSKRKIRNLYERLGYETARYPDHLNNQHLGKPSQGIMKLAKINRKARKKRGKLLEELHSEREQKPIEFVFHLIKNDFQNLPKYMTATGSYPGVNPQYFDGRLVEIRSLAKIRPNDLEQQGVELCSWDEV